MQFEWDREKRLTNLSKHGLDFAEVERFDWDRAHITPHLRSNERRFVALGYVDNRLHVLVYVHRGANRRIISFRKANRREERRYAQTRKVG